MNTFGLYNLKIELVLLKLRFFFSSLNPKMTFKDLPEITEVPREQLSNPGQVFSLSEFHLLHLSDWNIRKMGTR